MYSYMANSGTIIVRSTLNQQNYAYYYTPFPFSVTKNAALY